MDCRFSAFLMECKEIKRYVDQNQRLLHNKIQQSNQLIAALEQEMKQSNKIMDEVKINSYITAYNSTAIAKELGAMDYINTLYLK